MSTLTKLQIRAKVLSVITEICSAEVYNESLLKKLSSELENIEDKQALFDVFIKEFIKMDEKEYSFSGCLLKLLVPVDYINDYVLDSLKSTSLSDDIKYKLVQLMRIVGGDCDYAELPLYFDNPEEVLDKETKKLLENAVFNPEAMLDFLDFVSAVSKDDRNLLLASLKSDYQGDVLANIIYPILYSDFDDEFVLDVIEVLSESKSSIAIAPLEYIVNTSSNNELISSAKLALKKLKFAGATKENADLYFMNIIKDTEPAEFFTTIPDGSGNQALLVTRKNKSNNFLLFAIVVNDISGIVDSFGFYNISQDELLKVIGKFYQNEGKYKVEPSYVKFIVEQAINQTISNKRKFPYEFICWSPLLKDIKTLESNIENYVFENCNKIELSTVDVCELLTKEYTLRWFISSEESNVLKNILDEIYSQSELNIDFVNEKLKQNIEFIFDDCRLDYWKKRFINMIYLLKTNNLLKDSDKFYSIYINEEFFNLFKSVILQRSIFNHFVSIKENLNDSFFATNIFKKRNSSESAYDVKKVAYIVNLLKKSWIDG